VNRNKTIVRQKLIKMVQQNKSQVHSSSSSIEICVSIKGCLRGRGLTEPRKKLPSSFVCIGPNDSTAVGWNKNLAVLRLAAVSLCRRPIKMN